MYNSDEIYEMLRSGATSDELAKSFSDALNEAIKMKKAEEEHREDEKLDWLEDIMLQTNDWVEEYYPELAEKEKDDVRATAKNIIKIMDGLAKTIKSIDKKDEKIDFSGLDGLLKSFGLL